MPRDKDITGQRFGFLVVVERVDQRRGCWRWLCQCDCGNMKVVEGGNLRRGATQSCGCFHKSAHVTHGQSYSQTYRIWAGILERCRNSNSKNYDRYGGRGIEVRYSGFEDFLADMGERPPGHDVHRKDNDGHYEPGNCIWLAHDEHARIGIKRGHSEH